MLYYNTIIALKLYTDIYPENDITDIVDFVKKNQTSIRRSNIHGHVTASGLVLKNKKILLVFHKKLQRFIQPGGHLETTDLSLRGAAQREVQEETGIKVVSMPLFPYEAPFHIDAHIIPENQKKGEPEHWHYDCMFLFTPENHNVSPVKKEEVLNPTLFENKIAKLYSSPPQEKKLSDRININNNEVDDYQWASLDCEFNDKGLALAVAKIRKLFRQ